MGERVTRVRGQHDGEVAAQDEASACTAAELAGLLRQLRRREARRRDGSVLTYRELAAKTGWSRTAIGDYLTGTTLPPTERFDTLVHLLGAGPVEQGLLATARDRVEESRQSPTLSATNRPTGGQTRRVIPRQLPAAVRAFTGRHAEVQRLAALADEAADNSGTAGGVVIAVIDGTAGIGKSALAVHVAHRLADRFPDGQLYADLRGFHPAGAAAEPSEVIRGFLDALAVPADQIPRTLPERTGLYRTLLAGRRMLVILDNAMDAAQVRPLLPGTSGCLVVATSRNRLTSLVAAEGAEALPLELLSAAEGRELLTSRLGAGRVSAEPAAADDIVERCARLPLALSVVAGRAAAAPLFPLGALAKELRDPAHSLDALDGGEPTTDVRSVLSWSVRRLSPESARLFRLLSLPRGPDIGVPAAASLAGLPAQPVRQSLRELCAANLLTERNPGRYAWHDVLRAYATELAHTDNAEGDRRAAGRRVLDHYLHTGHAAALLLDPHRTPITPPAPHPGVRPEPLAEYAAALAWFTTEHPALLAAINMSVMDGRDSHTWQLAWTVATFLDRHGRWDELATTHRAGLAAAQRLADQPGQARAHGTLGRAYAKLGRCADAHAHLRRAGELYREIDDRAGLCCVRFDLASLLAAEGRYQEALRCAEQALTMYRTAGHQSGQARALSAAAGYHARLGAYADAFATGEQARRLQQDIGDRRGEAGTWDSLGLAYYRAGDFLPAVGCHRRAAALFGDLGDGYYQAVALRWLARGQQAAGDASTARATREQALRILDDLGHPEVAQVRAELVDPRPALTCGAPHRP